MYNKIKLETEFDFTGVLSMVSQFDEATDEILKLIIAQLDCVAITDAEGRYLYVNQSWSDIMGGITLDEIKGKLVKDVIPDTKMHEALESKKPIIGHAIKTRGPDEKKAFTSYLPIFKDGEVVAGFIHVIIIGMKSALDFTNKVSTMASQIEYYREELKRIRGAKYFIDNIIGESIPIKNMKEEIKRASRSTSTVLIEGETGSGKELVAHSIHDLSSRTSCPFIKVNCAAIPHELLESEFFGYEDGAFSGAKRGGKIGKFEMAQNGSLFLDEINQLPYDLQPKLLRALQEKEIERIGGKDSISVNSRIIVATNVSLKNMIHQNKFRSDLYYRLNVIKIKVPPLRERLEDIPSLCDDLLKRLNHQLGMNVPSISDESKLKLKEYDWPGNVRELQNVIERAMNMSWGEKLEWTHFEQYFDDKTYSVQKNIEKLNSYEIKKIKNNLEKDTIIKALNVCKNNKTQAAKILGISRTMLYSKLEKYEIY